MLHYMYTIHFIYPFTHQWTFGLLPPVDYREYGYYELRYTKIYSSLCFQFFGTVYLEVGLLDHRCYLLKIFL